MPGIDPQDGALAFGLTLGAGLCTTIGAAVVFNDKLVFLANKEFLASSLGVAAGVMLYVSFVEIFVKSVGGFSDAGNSDGASNAFATLSFFSGILLGNILDWFTHWLGKLENGGNETVGECCDIDSLGDVTVELAKVSEEKTKADEAKCSAAKHTVDGLHKEDHVSNGQTSGDEETSTLNVYDAKGPEEKDQKKLVRMGMLTALAIGIHNFPEGLATFVATLDDPTVGAGLAIAIAIHNVPEGLCVAIPIYYATGDRWQAFKWALISGISEPIGAALGWAILYSVMDDTLYGVIFGLVAGMMINICIHELLPTAYKYDPSDKYVTKSVIFGMAIMALSLVLFTLDYN